MQAVPPLPPRTAIGATGPAADNKEESARNAEPSEPFIAPLLQRLPRHREIGFLGALRRLIGMVIAGVLGAVCAYGIVCWIGGEKKRFPPRFL